MNTNASQQVIGFATEFYTLWNYHTSPRYVLDSYGKYHQAGVDHHYEYVKNITTDEDKARALYPTARFDKDLRGSRSFIREEKNLPIEFFWFGKYSGQKIEDVIQKDFAYCLWAEGNASLKVSEYIKSLPVWSEKMKEREAGKANEIADYPSLKKGEVVNIHFTTNGYTKDGLCQAKGFVSTPNGREIVVYVAIKNFKEVDGIYPYIMPVINGKAQKTKGKVFSVEVAEINKEWLTKYKELHQVIEIK